MSTSVDNVISHFPSAENGFSTTTASTTTSGATVVELDSLSGYENGEVVVFIIDPADATKKQTFTGVVDTGGVQITDVIWTAGDNQAHSSGAVVVDYATATHISMISKGLSVSHNQDGTLKTGTVGNSNLKTTTGEVGGAWQDWTPSFTNLTIGSGSYIAKYIQIGKTIHGYFDFTFGSGSAVGDVKISVPVATSMARNQIATCIYEDATSTDYSGVVWYETDGTFRCLINNVASTYTSVAAISASVPFTWATGDRIAFSFTYEAS